MAIVADSNDEGANEWFLCMGVDDDDNDVINRETTHVRFHPSAIKLNQGIFSDCKGKLMVVNLQDANGISEIPSSAFQGCFRLREVHLPQHGSLCHIQSKAFSGALALEEIHLPSTLLTIGAWAFQRCERLQRICVPAGVTEIGARAFQACGALRQVEFAQPSQLEKIGGHAFAVCSSLETMHLPDSVRIIRHGAFFGCMRLTTIRLPPMLIQMEDRVLSLCLGLETVHLACPFGLHEPKLEGKLKWGELKKRIAPFVRLNLAIHRVLSPHGRNAGHGGGKLSPRDAVNIMADVSDNLTSVYLVVSANPQLMKVS